jgi:lysophospholipase L1-like esterase
MVQSRFAPRHVLSVFSLFVLVGCGSSSTGPKTPTPTAAGPTFSVPTVVFLDDNNDGVQGADEPAVVPYALIEIGGQVATSAEGTGGATVGGVKAGTYPINFRKLPPYYQPGQAKTATVPPTGTILVPVTLNAENSTPGLYLSSGDSISQGIPGSIDDTGYRSILEARLQAAFVRTRMEYRGGGGYASDHAAFRIDRDLRILNPSFVLVGWGTNDWNPQPNLPGCQADPAPPCPLIDNLRSVIDSVKRSNALATLSTLTPPHTTLSPVERYNWVLKANDLIRALAKEEGVLLVDLGDAFIKTGNVNDYMFDYLHPNDKGYKLIADTFFKALTEGTLSSAGRAPLLLPFSSSDRRR